MLEIKKITKSFGNVKAVNNISLSFSEGIVTTILGANGAGKTTLMRLICGILDPDDGWVNIFGKDITRDRIAALEYVGYMPENNPLYQDFSVLELLFFMAKIKKTDTSIIIDLLESLALKDVKDQIVGTLSKGYKSRVAIAVTLISKPKILILDEPTEGLDPNQKQKLRELLKEYAKNNIVLMSTHIIEEAQELESRIVVLNKGEVVFDNSFLELKKKEENVSYYLRKMME